MMTEHDRVGTLKEHEKFWAFIFLIVMVGLLVLLASSFDRSISNVNDMVMQAKLRIIDASITGLLTIAGMAAQALFRISSSDRIHAEAALEQAKKVPAPTQEVEIKQPASNPVPTVDVQPQAEAEGDAAWMKR